MKQEKQKITLGIDLGTQFCSAGYVLNHKYYQVRFGQKYVVPTVVCLDSYGNETYGEVAVDKISRSYNSGGIYTLAPGYSIKTLLRDGCEKAEFNNCSDESPKNQPTVKTLMQNLIHHLADKIKESIGNDITIDKINVAYSEITGEGDDIEKRNNNYVSIVKDQVKKEFDVSDKNVSVIAEFDLAARLFKNICKSYNANAYSNQQIICTIDVGAGTTDISCMSWNSDENQYKVKCPSSCRFGGKCVDEVLTKRKVWPIYDPDTEKYPDKIRRDILFSDSCPYTIIEHKRWLANVREGDMIFESTKTQEYIQEEAKNSTYHSAVNILVEKFCRSEGVLGIQTFGDFEDMLRNVYNELGGMLKELGRRLENLDEVQFILMGGSSELPFVWKALTEVAESVIGRRNIRLNVKYLKDMVANTPMSYIDNTNFIARAAAGYDDEIYTDYYAIRYRDKNTREDGYKVISCKGNLDGYYYDTNPDTMVDKKNNPCNFVLDGACYNVSVTETKAMEIALKGINFQFVDKKFVVKAKQLENNDNNKDFISVPEVKDDGPFNVGCHMDKNREGGHKLEIYVFGKNKSYIGKNCDLMDKEDFILMAYITGEKYDNKQTFDGKFIDDHKLKEKYEKLKEKYDNKT